MSSKTDILQAVSDALRSGVITTRDLQKIIGEHHVGEDSEPTKTHSARVSAVDIMFYIAGIVLFAAIMALVGQLWDSGPSTRILLSGGLGALFWAVALYFTQAPGKDDIRRGITNSMLLTGSLSLIAGGFIIANEYFDFDDFNFYASALTLFLLGAIHVGFGWQIRRNLLVLAGILLAVAAFPSFTFGLLTGSDMPMFVYCLIIAASGGLLAYATRVASRIGASVGSIERFFDPLSAFVILMSLYAASYDKGNGIVWLLALVMGIIGLFYLSITTQNKLLLGNGSFFLVLAIITISYRYFSDSPAISLLVSAAGLLGTAIMAAHINRRYIK